MSRLQPSSNFLFALLLLDFVVMFRFYALSNLLELGLVLSIVLAKDLRRKLLTVVKHKAVVSLGILILWMSFSIIWSEGGSSQIFEDLWTWRKCLLFVICLVLLDSVQRVRTLIVCFLMLMTFVAAVVLIMAAAINFTNDGEFIIEVVGRTPVHVLQNHTAQGVCSALAVVALVAMRDQVDGMVSRQEKQNFLAYALLIPVWIWMGTYLGTSKSGYVSFLVIAIVLALASLNWRRRIADLLPVLIASQFCVIVLAFGILAVGTAVVGSDNIGSLIFDNFGSSLSDLTSTSRRIIMYATTLDVINNNMMFGVGAGSFEQTAWESTAFSSLDNSLRFRTNDPHNIYLSMLARYGLVGLFLFCLFVYQIAISIAKHETFRPFFLCVLILFLILGWFNTILETSVLGRFFFVFFGAAVALSEVSETVDFE